MSKILRKSRAKSRKKSLKKSKKRRTIKRSLGGNPDKIVTIQSYDGTDMFITSMNVIQRFHTIKGLYKYITEVLTTILHKPSDKTKNRITRIMYGRVIPGGTKTFVMTKHNTTNEEFEYFKQLIREDINPIILRYEYIGSNTRSTEAEEAYDETLS